MVQVTPHESARTAKGTPGPDPATACFASRPTLDVPAGIVALLYQHGLRLNCFSFFKHLLGCRHLLSDKPEGLRIQVYCAIIACMLLSLWTNRKPTKATLEMFYYYFTGLAEDDELENHLQKLKLHTA